MREDIIIKMEKPDHDDEYEEKTPVAFIVNAPAKYGYTLCYAHIGQHSEANNTYMRFDCDPVETAEDVIKAYELLQELQSIGYEIGED